MIESFAIENVGPIQRVEGRLTALHAFIGPNDSGKSTILRALSDAAGLYARTRTAFPSYLRSSSDVRLDLTGGLQLQVTQNRLTPDPTQAPGAREQLEAALLLRLDPDALGAPSQLIPDDRPLRFLSDRGAGLAGICDALLNRADGSFEALSRTVSQHFATVKGLRLATVSQTAKTLEAVLQDGTRVPAAQMSEGFLYFVAIAVLPHIQAGRLIFLEEPENGLHPARVAEVMNILRSLSERGLQVVMATHSPLVVNELRPDEVTVVTRDLTTGTRLTPLVATPNFANRSKVYALGELWLSYANGIDEAPLLTGGDTP